MKLDYTKPYLRTVTLKEVNGVIERTFVLTPVKAKDKPKKERTKRVRQPLGTCKPFPKQEETERDEQGNIIPYAMWSEQALAVLAEHRRIKKEYDEATTEIITLSNGFKQKVHHKIEFPDRSMKPLTPSQRAGLTAKHRTVEKFRKNIATKENATKYPMKPFEAKLFNKNLWAELRAKRWKKRDKLEAIHESRIQAILERLKNTYLIQKVHATKIDANTGVLKRKTIEKVQSTNLAEKVAKTAAKCTNPPTKHVFATNAKDKVPHIGKAVEPEMKLAA